MVATEPGAGKCNRSPRSLGGMPSRVQRSVTATMAKALGSRVVRSEVFPASRNQVARVRAVISEIVADHPAFDTIVLLASEVATNSVLHSGSEFFGLVIARTTSGDLRVAVIDEGCGGLPRLRDEAIEDEHGRGLHLVDTLAQSWGITRQPGVGAAVWFDIR
jgi:serine/threonine-protein kinase RsbW